MYECGGRKGRTVAISLVENCDFNTLLALFILEVDGIRYVVVPHALSFSTVEQVDHSRDAAIRAPHHQYPMRCG